MWLITNRGFYSAVEHRDDPNAVLVRARSEEDINNLASMLPGSKPWKDDTADYLWRLSCSKEEWAGVVAEFALNTNYDNFKSSVDDPLRQQVYMEVWSALYFLQDPDPYKWLGFKNGRFQ